MFKSSNLQSFSFSRYTKYTIRCGHKDRQSTNQITPLCHVSPRNLCHPYVCSQKNGVWITRNFEETQSNRRIRTYEREATYVLSDSSKPPINGSSVHLHGGHRRVIAAADRGHNRQSRRSLLAIASAPHFLLFLLHFHQALSRYDCNASVLQLT